LPQTRQLYGSGQTLLQIGEQTSRAGSLLAQGIERALSSPAAHLDERLAVFSEYVNAANEPFTQAQDGIKTVDPKSLPSSLQVSFGKLESVLQDGAAAMADLKDVLSFGMTALGHDRPRTYLVLFQNQTELRPTGGFIGSLAEVVIDRGEIKSTFIPGGGPYDFRSQMRSHVAAPEPLRLLRAEWEIQDANWFPDFAASAQKTNWFWSQAGEPTADGVIAVNASVLQTLLRLTGPIEMPAYGKTLTADNVIPELQQAVEVEYDRTENKPKKIIADLFPLLLEKMKSGDQNNSLKYLGALAKALETKDVQMWFPRAEEQALAERFQVAGRIRPTLGDALGVIEANIGGQKTDAVIKEDVHHEVVIAEDGTIEDTVTITRDHTGIKGDLFYGAHNVAYVRAYVPEGSTLLDATGFDAPSSSLFKIPASFDAPDKDLAKEVTPLGQDMTGVMLTQEFSRTAFGGWVQLKPGWQQTISFKYKLPFSAFDITRRVNPGVQETTSRAGRPSYLLDLTSQSGKTDRGFTLTLHYPSVWHVAWASGSWTHVAGESQAIFSGLDRDQVLAIAFDPISTNTSFHVEP
jgi:hypothetical protein